MTDKDASVSPLCGFNGLFGIAIPAVWNQRLELVTLTVASWNQIGKWLRRVDGLRQAA